MRLALDPCPRPSCGHPRAFHEHLRHGDDCGVCDCPMWPGIVAQVWFRAARRLLARR